VALTTADASRRWNQQCVADVSELTKLVEDLWNVREHGIPEMELWTRVCRWVVLPGLRPVDETGRSIVPREVPPVDETGRSFVQRDYLCPGGGKKSTES